ncbi:MAG: hypothetical protein AAGG47_19945 [Pseudomonadota bacterium]
MSRTSNAHPVRRLLVRQSLPKWLLIACLMTLSAPKAVAQTRDRTQAENIVLEDVDWASVPQEVADFPGVPLFTMPRVNQELRLVTTVSAARNFDNALRLIDNLITRYPLVSDFHATRAALLAARGETGAALAALDRALDLGFDRVGTLRRLPVFKEFSSNPGFRDVTARRRNPYTFTVPAPTPDRIEGQTGEVDAANTRWSPAQNRLQSVFEFPEAIERRAPFALAKSSPAIERLAERLAAGEAAGLAGILYDNRDRDHVTIARERYPQLSFVEYGRAAKAAGLDYGLNVGLLFNAITIGNSSTARTGRLWRSQPRVALTEPFGPQSMAQLYVADHLYFFPEHRDHDPVEEDGKGDVFPANTPFFMVSQGSSGSERRLLQGALLALAALTPETRSYLDQRNLVAPTLQMILRRAMAPVADDAETYLSGIAHPSAFKAGQLDLDLAIDIAARLTPQTIPPIVLMRVLQEESGLEGRDYFGEALNERLFDTPLSIARIWRSAQSRRRLVVFAGPSFELGEDTVQMHWRLLRGDPERVTITPRGDDGRRAEIVVDWQDRGTVPGRPELTTDRIDIGVFADNGSEISAPAFISILMPSHQERRYEPDGEGGMRPLEIDYQARADDESVYQDPVIFPARDWRDRYDYGPDGTLQGWTRIYTGDRERERYTASGQLVRESDASGRPTVVESMEYPLVRRGDSLRFVRPEPTGRLFDYVYANDNDVSGVLVPQSVAQPADAGN